MSDNKNDGKGFAGLDSMVSDVSDNVRPVSPKPAQPQQEPPRQPPPGPPPVQAAPVQPQSTPQSRPAPIVSGKQPSGGKNWLLWGGIIIFLIWVFGNSGKSNNNSSYSPAQSYSPPTSSAPGQASEPTPIAVFSDGEKPPIGSGLSFNREQIRYCLTENHRVSAIESIIDNTRSNEVDAYNAMVDDYNNRCSHFRYRRGILEGVKTEVDARADEIRRAAQSSWVRKTIGLETPANEHKVKPQATQSHSKQTQRSKDTSRRGQEPHVADKQVEATAPNISVQNRPPDILRQDRSESAALPKPPEHARIASWGNDWVCDSGYRKQGNQCVKVETPLHAHLASWGTDWQCDSGYKQQGNQCIKVDIPPNAHLASWGSDWQCDSGYKQQGDQCTRVDIPPNAHLASWGSDWQCNSGYKQQGKECVKVEVPPNAHLASWGSDWQCNSGYRRQGNYCEKLSVPPNARVASWGSDWVCNDGYRQIGNECRSVFESNK